MVLSVILYCLLWLWLLYSVPTPLFSTGCNYEPVYGRRWISKLLSPLHSLCPWRLGKRQGWRGGGEKPGNILKSLGGSTKILLCPDIFLSWNQVGCVTGLLRVRSLFWRINKVTWDRDKDSQTLDVGLVLKECHGSPFNILFVQL